MYKPLEVLYRFAGSGLKPTIGQAVTFKPYPAAAKRDKKEFQAATKRPRLTTSDAVIIALALCQTRTYNNDRVTVRPPVNRP